MTGRMSARRAGSRQVRRRLIAGLALLWCLALVGLLRAGPIGPAWAAGAAWGQSGRAAIPSGSPTATPTATPSTPAPSPTTAQPTATSAPTSAPTAAPQPTATQPAVSGAGGAAPQPTRQNLAQPTIGASQQGPVGSYTPSNLASPWLLVLSALGCVFGLLGLGTLMVTWYLLASDGWTPVVKAVLLGNRKGKRRFPQRSSGPSGRARRPVAAPISAQRARGGWR